MFTFPKCNIAESSQNQPRPSRSVSQRRTAKPNSSGATATTQLLGNKEKDNAALSAMGNGVSSDGLSKPLAITALARQLQFSKDQVISLRCSFVDLGSPDETISRNNFRLALHLAKITREQDLEIFDLLFTMWDSQGADKVQCKEFLMGISPLACADEPPSSILRFALQVSDEEKTGVIGSDELEDMLLSIDSTASFFGDPHLKYKCIRRVVDCVFEDEEGEILHQACVQKLLGNAYIRRFVSGKTRTRVKFKDDLVVEYQDKSQNELPSRQDDLQSRQVPAVRHHPQSRHDPPSSGFYRPMDMVVDSLMDSFTISISSSSLSSSRASSTAPSPRHSFAASPRDFVRSRGVRDITSHTTIQRDTPKYRRSTVRIE